MCYTSQLIHYVACAILLHDETIFHIVSSCPFLAATDYLQRHNSVASLIHKQICMAYGIATNERAWLYRPQPVVTSGDVKVLWDADIRTDRVISAHRPEIVIHDGSEHSAMLLFQLIWILLIKSEKRSWSMLTYVWNYTEDIEPQIY